MKYSVILSSLFAAAITAGTSSSAMAASAPTMEVTAGCDASSVSDSPWEGRSCQIKLKNFNCPTVTGTYYNGNTIKDSKGDWGVMTPNSNGGYLTGTWDEISFFGHSMYRYQDGLFSLDCTIDAANGGLDIGVRYHDLEYDDFPKKFRDYAEAVEKNDRHGHGIMHFQCNQSGSDIACNRRH